MLTYSLRVALLSMRRNRGLTLLVVAGVALGVAVSTLLATVRHAFAKDPIPEKSDVLFYVRLDSWDPLKPYPGDRVDSLPTQLTYRDTIEIMKSTIPLRQSAMFKSELYVFPEAQDSRPKKAKVRLCFSDFFEMFQVPFLYGAPWDKALEASAEPVVVLTREMNDELFGGENSVGRRLRVEDREFRVVGVLGEWRPSVKFYDITQNYVEPPESLFIPFPLVRPMKIQTTGNSDGWRSAPAPGLEGTLASEACWIQMWVELSDRNALSAYEDFLRAYALEQKKTGRFQRPINNKVTPLMDWMAEQNVVPPQASALAVVGFLFLAVCALNLMGLLLSKFLARAAEVGVRRALGARRRDVFVELLVECELLSIVGGVLGTVLAGLGLGVANSWFMQSVGRGDTFRLDLPMLALAIGSALAAGLIAGAYPAWRICITKPAVHLKLQ